MSRIEERLEEHGLSLPTPMTPPGTFQPVLLRAGPAYVAGHGPFEGSTPPMQGVVGRDLTLEQGYEAARLTAGGRHARSAPGQEPSPFNVPVIVDAIVAVERS